MQIFKRRIFAVRSEACITKNLRCLSLHTVLVSDLVDHLAWVCTRRIPAGIGGHYWPKMQMSLRAVTAAWGEEKDHAHVSFSHVKMCQMSHWFGGFFEHWFSQTLKCKLAYTQPSPAKTNTAGYMQGQALKMLTTGKRAALQQIRARAERQGQLFNRVVGALCGF